VSGREALRQALVVSQGFGVAQAEHERSAADYLPPGRLSLPKLAAAAQGCRGCDLYKRATQAVFGEGPSKALVMMVGEQPGDREDLQGKPFVGPAGAVLDKALAAAGINREVVYVTNAVKHFKWEARGKRRIHSKPSAREVRACQPWLEAEIATVRPQVVVAMGATAARSLLGPAFRLTKHRGEFIEGTLWAPLVTATVHPSSILRAPDDAARREAMAAFIADLKVVAQRLATVQVKGPGVPGRGAGASSQLRPPRPSPSRASARHP
jgi:uracil-DNA glycosylase family protein